MEFKFLKCLFTRKGKGDDTLALQLRIVPQTRDVGPTDRAVTERSDTEPETKGKEGPSLIQLEGEAVQPYTGRDQAEP